MKHLRAIEEPFFDPIEFAGVVADIELNPLPPHANEIVQRVLAGLPANPGLLKIRGEDETNWNRVDKAPFAAMHRLRALGLLEGNNASALLVAINDRGLLGEIVGGVV